MKTRKTLLKFALTSSLAVAVSACSVTVGSGDAVVSVSELENTIITAVDNDTGVTPDYVKCPEPLPAEPGSVVRCTITDDDVSYGVTATSDGLVGERVDYTIQIDAEPLD